MFAANTPPSSVLAVLGEFSDDTADHQFNIPLPTTARIVQAFFKPSGAFTPDISSGAVDVAPVGVGYALNP
ncbi:hypothetical protein D3C81_2135620 [compost metagenome]